MSHRLQAGLSALTAGLLDQATFALLYSKFQMVSITLGPSSLLFWYYAPACFLSDLLVVAVLHAMGYYLRYSESTEGRSNIQYTRVAENEWSPEVGQEEGRNSDESSMGGSLSEKEPANRRFRLTTATRLVLQVCLMAVASICTCTAYTSITAYKAQRTYDVHLKAVCRAYYLRLLICSCTR